MGPIYWGSVAQGLNQGIDSAQAQQIRAAELKQYQYALEQKRAADARALQAQQGAGATLGQLMAPPPVSQPSPQPPMPGQPSVPGSGASSMAPPKQIPPYQTVQGAGQNAQMAQTAPQGPMSPPAVGAQPQQPAQASMGQRPTVEGVLRIMQANGVPQDQWLPQLEQLKPVFDMANKQELEELKAQANSYKMQRDQMMDPLRMQNLQSMIDKRNRTGSGGGASGAGGGMGGAGAYEKLSADQKQTVDYYAQRSMQGDDTWKTGMSRSKQGAALILAVNERIAQKSLGGGGMSAGDVISNKAETAGLNKAIADRTKYSAGVSQASRRVDSQINIVDSLLDKGGLNTPTIINKRVNALRGSLSDKDYSTLNAAMVTLANEVQKLNTAATSNAQLHATTTELYNGILNGNMSIAQIRDQFALIKREAEATTSTAADELNDLKTKLKNVGKSGGSAGSGGGVVNWGDLK